MPYDPAEGLINGSNLVGGLIQQGRQTQDYVSGMFDDAAKRRAGAAVARGDYGEASQVLGGRGLIDAAGQMRERAATGSALEAVNAGDFGRAKEAAVEGGDTQLYAGVGAAEDKDRAERSAWLGHAADALLQVKDPAQREQAFKQYVAPTLKAMGVKDDQMASITGQTMTDEGLHAFKTSLGQAAKRQIKQDADGNWVAIDEQAGSVTKVADGSRKPEWQKFTRRDGSTYWKDLNAPGGAQEGPGPGAAAPSATPEPKGIVYQRIGEVAEAVGAKPPEVTYLKRLAQVESGGSAKAKNGSSTGVFQFHPDTFESVGGGDINDVEDQTRAALALQRRDRAKLQQLGVEPDDANAYIMHQQGPGGGPALLTAPPETSAVAALTPAYNGNAAMARKAIVGNGGKADMTAGEFVDYWRERWAGGAKAAPTGEAKATSGRVVEGDEAPAPEWVDLPGGGQRNTRTGEKKNVPGFEDGALPPETGLRPVGDPKLGVYKNDVGQKFQTNRAGTITRLSGPTDTQVGETVKKIKAINDTISMVDEVDQQFRRTRVLGPGGRYIVNQVELAKLDAMTKQLQIAYKNAAELGAITGPDVPFIESVAPNPRELKSLVQRNEFIPRLSSLAKVSGKRYRAELDAFKALGGDPGGLTPMYTPQKTSAAGKTDAPKGANAFADSGKEARYQAWLKAHPNGR